ncbi:MAG: hypothetical protein AAFY06_14105, partial [Pseudomonadota bacterium]
MSGPEAINAAENDFITADLFVSFRLDTSTPIFDIAAGENVPGLSVPPPERLVSYDASAISNLSGGGTDRPGTFSPAAMSKIGVE